MNRSRRHKIKQELPEASTSISRQQTEHDLAYYIHDRVELVHQVFSVLKPKDLKAMAPECVRHISTKDLQELCTEELLGISSKRLLSILDGAEPPSDTESSSPSPAPELETISLDSISSDEEILSQGSRKKKHKHRRRGSKSKKKKSAASSASAPPASAPGGSAWRAEAEQARASRAGLTVLELLELQARARAIRAQLHQDSVHRNEPAPAIPASQEACEGGGVSSDGEVVIKEEPSEVVEITSSEDEKPPVERLLTALEPSTSKEPDNPEQSSSTVTKKVNELTITVPQTKQTRKIKLNRNKVTVSVPNVDATVNEPIRTVTESTSEAKQNGKKKKTEKHKGKPKKKKKEKRNTDKENSDHDEITLQLSDSEKMDLLEDFDRKHYDVVTSSSSEDSESSSEDSDNDDDKNTKNDHDVRTTDSTVKSTVTNVPTDKTAVVSNNSNSSNSDLSKKMSPKDISLDDNVSGCAVLDINDLTIDDNTKKYNTEEVNNTNVCVETKDVTESNANESTNLEKSIVINSVDDIPVSNEFAADTEVQIEENSEDQHAASQIEHVTTDTHSDDIQSNLTQDKIDDISPKKTVDSGKDNVKNLRTVSGKESEKSEGEMSDHESSEVEASDLKPEVVCISDDEVNNKKKKKKKDKKSKKSKKSKKKKDFHEATDQNFYEDADNIEKTHETLDVNDDVYEILEILSDDSSCYEVEGTVLSKEPTADEIEALSAKIDEIEKQEVADEHVIENTDSIDLVGIDRQSESSEDIENISWKDRYLDSKKVKRVLSTANILNALRKKNKELKNKMEKSKRAELVEQETKAVDEKDAELKSLEEGSIEHYKTLEGSTKFVDPVKEAENKIEDGDKAEIENGYTADIEPIHVTGEMKKDAKQLLKMYKRLLKQCKAKGGEKSKDSVNKKKKKTSKNKKETAGVATNVDA